MNSIVDKIYNKIESLVEEKGFVLYDIEYVVEHSTNFLRIYIDTTSDEKIKIDDCILVSNCINELFDKDDPIETEYTIEVASPGIIRKLTKEKHFKQVVNEKIFIKFYKKHEYFESKEVEVVLKEVHSDYIVVEDNIKILNADIAKAMTTFEF